jgi:hypothetical protein
MVRHSAASVRAITIVAGIWLFISAFLWPHTAAQRTNTWILGILAVLIAAAATQARALRYLNTALSVWLFVSAFALTTMARGTIWNNAIVAIVIFFLSLVPASEAAVAPAGTAPTLPERHDQGIPEAQQPHTV